MQEAFDEKNDKVHDDNAATEASDRKANTLSGQSLPPGHQPKENPSESREIANGSRPPGDDRLDGMPQEIEEDLDELLDLNPSAAAVEEGPTSLSTAALPASERNSNGGEAEQQGRSAIAKEEATPADDYDAELDELLDM
mmetsp:Transcript_46850/g.75314  ORF Transcript_46850/g.75314 Transcript_46850/m.75314 type:complete len:140 (+) Transcript_46850:185-604(+)